MRVSQALLILALAAGFAAAADSPSQTFLGQTTPGTEAVKFAPDALATELCLHGALSFTPDSKELYWSAMLGPGMAGTICSSTFDGKALGKPTVAALASGLDCGGLTISPDGKRAFFNSEIPVPGDTSKKKSVIFTCERTTSGWSKPVVITATDDTTVTKGQVSVARDGDLYFGGRVLSERTPAIFVCTFTGGEYSPPQKLTGPIAGLPLAVDPWVDPDERFMLLSCPPVQGPPMLTDIGISVRQTDGGWGIPTRIDAINTPNGFERFPSLSPDGKYLFFIRSTSPRFVGAEASFYWVSASVIDSLKVNK